MSTSPENDLPCRLNPQHAAGLMPSSVESAIAEDPSPFFRPSVSAPCQVKLRVNIFWSLSDTGVYSVNAGQMPPEVISRAAKKLRELGAATGFVFNRASARNRCLTITMQRIRLRTEVPPSLSSDALN